MTPYQVSSEIYGGLFYPGITLRGANSRIVLLYLSSSRTTLLYHSPVIFFRLLLWNLLRLNTLRGSKTAFLPIKGDKIPCLFYIRVFPWVHPQLVLNRFYNVYICTCERGYYYRGDTCLKTLCFYKPRVIN